MSTVTLTDRTDAMNNERTDRTEIVATLYHAGKEYRVSGVLADGLYLGYSLGDLLEFLGDEIWRQLTDGREDKYHAF